MTACCCCCDVDVAAVVAVVDGETDGRETGTRPGVGVRTADFCGLTPRAGSCFAVQTAAVAAAAAVVIKHLKQRAQRSQRQRIASAATTAATKIRTTVHRTKKPVQGNM